MNNDRSEFEIMFLNRVLRTVLSENHEKVLRLRVIRDMQKSS